MPSCASSASPTCSARRSYSRHWRCCPLSCSNDMTLPANTEISSQLITLFAALMLVLQLLLVVQRMLLTNIRIFALQSLMLAAIATVVASAHHASHVYAIAILTLLGKVILLPRLLTRLVRRINIVQEIEPLLNAPTSM